jgi:hypothetical protein
MNFIFFKNKMTMGLREKLTKFVAMSSKDLIFLFFQKKSNRKKNNPRNLERKHNDGSRRFSCRIGNLLRPLQQSLIVNDVRHNVSDFALGTQAKVEAVGKHVRIVREPKRRLESETFLSDEISARFSLTKLNNDTKHKTGSSRT